MKLVVRKGSWEKRKEDFIEEGQTWINVEWAPDRTFVYSKLHSGFDEVPDMIDRIQKMGFRYYLPGWAKRNRRWKWIFLGKPNEVWAEIDRKFASSFFHDYIDWGSDRWEFLIGPH